MQMLCLCVSVSVCVSVGGREDECVCAFLWVCVQSWIHSYVNRQVYVGLYMQTRPISWHNEIRHCWLPSDSGNYGCSGRTDVEGRTDAHTHQHIQPHTSVSPTDRVQAE